MTGSKSTQVDSKILLEKNLLKGIVGRAAIPTPTYSINNVVHKSKNNTNTIYTILTKVYNFSFGTTFFKLQRILGLKLIVTHTF